MNKSLSLVAALAAVVLTSTTFAYSPKDGRHQNAVDAIKLVPSKVVMPTNLPRSFLRSTVHVEFSIDQAGQPRDIKVLSSADRAVKDQVVAAFSQWRFEAAVGEPGIEAKRFVLPLEVVPQA
jgi:TonB family protein